MINDKYHSAFFSANFFCLSFRARSFNNRRRTCRVASWKLFHPDFCFFKQLSQPFDVFIRGFTLTQRILAIAAVVDVALQKDGSRFPPRPLQRGMVCRRGIWN